MSFETLLNQDVVITKMDPGNEDEMGNLELEASGSTVETKGRLQQTQPTEVTVGRDTAVSDWKLFLQSDEAIDHQDTVEVDGKVYEVLGTPYPVQTPLGTHHLEVKLRLAVG